MPVGRPLIVSLVPVPVVFTVPGYLVRVQVPVDGKLNIITLPVESVHVGSVLFPTEGATGIAGLSFIMILSDGGETHPASLVTVYVYVPLGRDVTVNIAPLPGRVIPPGKRVKVQVPVAGNPLKVTLPVEIRQSGLMIVSITGAVGARGCGWITTFADEGEVQPASLVTVYVYVPAISPVSVVLVPDPVVERLSGLLMMVHVPTDGKPLRTTLPVPPEHEMPVMFPIEGAEGLLFTDNANVETAEEHGEPRGLSVVTVIITTLPLSPDAGVYVNANGDVVNVGTSTEPAPFSVMDTLVALPENVFPGRVNGVVPHVLSLARLSVSTGALTQPQLTANMPESVVQSCGVFLTAR
jgi:hypothetical protein